jgi:hypothetical protein
MSTSPSGSASSRTTSSLTSLGTRAAFFGQLTHTTASSRMARRAAASAACSCTRRVTNRWAISVLASRRRTVRTPSGSGATSCG